VLDLFLEAREGTLLESADNLTAAPWGDLVVCEDGTGEDHLVGVTPSGELYHLARNQGGNGELAGVLTPAVAMGDVLIERLERAGIHFQVMHGA
jgi:secreted PhoX family phosphatase